MLQHEQILKHVKEKKPDYYKCNGIEKSMEIKGGGQLLRAASQRGS